MRPAAPDFIVIGAMKSATTTLHEQLARQPGIFMSRPKEPNFFSDDEVFARGFDWYASLFEAAPEGSIRGESSTHYTKRPNFPDTVERLASALPGIKLIYVMRHPIERLLSHYGHEVTNGRTNLGLRQAIEAVPELVDYSRYAMQLEPYLSAFGPANILPVFFRRIANQPQAELERICRFLGYTGRPVWDTTLKPQNVGRERLRKNAFRDVVMQAPLITPIRQRLLPKSLTEPIKSFWRSGVEHPALPDDLRDDLRSLFDDDLADLGQWLGIHLNCQNFRQATQAGPLEWVISG